MKNLPEVFVDGDGRQCSLDVMCRREPEWAANRIRTMAEELMRLRALVNATAIHQL